MRRKDREMDENFAIELLDTCDYMTMSMIDEDGEAYAVPLSMARLENKLYFHCALTGKKIDCLRKHPKVYITATRDLHLVPEKFTTEFASVFVEGHAKEVLDDEEKILGLRLICERYAKENMENFDQAIERSLERTGVWVVKILKSTSKRKKY